MKQVFLIPGVLLLLTAASAQQIDSLERFLQQKNLPDTDRVNALNMLGRELAFIDPIKSAKLGSEALQTSLKINYTKGQAYGYRGLSSVFSTNNKTIIAAEYLQKAIRLFEKLNDSAGLANCYITMGHAFRRSQRRREEIEYHKKAFEIFSRLSIPDRIAVSAHNLGESYWLTGNYSKSRDLTTYAIRLLTDPAGNLSILSNCFKVMGKLELAAGNLEAAEQYFLRVLSITDTLGNHSQKTATAESMINLAAIYRQTGSRDRQRSILNKASAFCEANSMSRYLQPVYSSLIALDADNKDSVYRHITEFGRVSDSVTARSARDQWELEKYGSEIYNLLENENRASEKKYILQTQRIKTTNLLLILSLAILLIFIALIFTLRKTLRRQKRAEEEIKRKSDQLQELAARLQNIREEERIAMAQEIHEGLGQQLIVIKMDIDWMKNKLGKTDNTFSERMEQASSQLDSVISDVRRIAGSLRPSTLDDIGLDVAIKWQLSEFEKHYGLKSGFTTSHAEPELPDAVKTGLFRIFQDAMMNVIQHANANTVTVRMIQQEHEISLTIEDDGIGFADKEIMAKKSIGLLAMKERCNMINGYFEITGIPGRGTKVVVTVPFTHTKVKKTGD
jgi:signal transduction histidine kinase